MKNLFRIHVLLLMTMLLGGGTLAWHWSTRAPLSPFETTVVRRGDVTQEVLVTGRVNSESKVDLAFERAGVITNEPLPVGTQVKSGEVLAILDTSELAALRSQARANVRVEEANLAQLQEGSRPEDIAVTEAQLTSAVSTHRDAVRTLEDKAEVSFTVSDDAIHNSVDQLFTNPRSANPELNLLISDTNLAITLPQMRAQTEQTLIRWSEAMNGTNTDIFITETENSLIEIKSFMELVAKAVNLLLPNSNSPQSKIDEWELDISTARTGVNTALSNFRTAKANEREKAQAVDIARHQLTLKTAGPTKEALAAQTAKIAAMRATLANYDAQISKMSLVAPFAGIISRQDTKRGAVVSPNIPVVSLISDGKWKIEANVPEADVAKIHVDDPAQISFDAYGSEVLFEATVSKIDPVETIIDGVSTYNVTLHLVQDDDRVRSGMTANITIHTEKRPNVLMIPSRAILTQGERKFVRTPSIDGQSAIEATVQTGLHGSDGLVEIISGLSEGDRVITFEQKP